VAAVPSRRRREEALEGIRVMLHDLVGRVDVVLVEGVRDVEALRSWGYGGDVEVLQHSGVSIVDVAISVAERHRRALVLTDVDDAGEETGRRLEDLLESHGVKVEREARRHLGGWFRFAGIHTIEALPCDFAADG
jgi:5S rRNA maturation endonuclease (ribonuclease M5)